MKKELIMEEYRFRQLFWRVLSLMLLCCFIFNTAQARVFKIVNNCSQNVWYGLLGPANSPKPNDGDYLITPGGSKTLTIPTGVWPSVVIAGRTGCEGGSCKTADCGGGTGGCTHGFAQPATQAEFTMNSNGVDTYDVEVINGINLPISVTPDVAANASNPYFCGAPGAPTPSPGLGACSWTFTPPSVEYFWVTSGGKACAANTDCESGTICGLSFNAGQQQLLQKTCGTQLGFWTANQICGVQRNYGAPFDCSGQLSTPQDGRTWWDLYACTFPKSCYSGGAASDCCGCTDWDTLGISVPPSTERCKNINSNWAPKVQDTLTWIKKACPTVYTYPFDDPSSTYTCNSGGGQNNANYTITFCPNGGGNPPLTHAVQ